jgi:hypothetical protein
MGFPDDRASAGGKKSNSSTGFNFDNLATGHADPHLGFIFVIQPAAPDSRTPAGFIIVKHDIADMDRGFLLYNPALGVFLGWAGVPLDHVDPLDQHTVLIGHHFEDFPNLAFLIAAQDYDFITFDNTHRSPWSMSCRF